MFLDHVLHPTLTTKRCSSSDRCTQLFEIPFFVRSIDPMCIILENKGAGTFNLLGTWCNTISKIQNDLWLQNCKLCTQRTNML